MKVPILQGALNHSYLNKLGYNRFKVRNFFFQFPVSALLIVKFFFEGLSRNRAACKNERYMNTFMPI